MDSQMFIPSCVICNQIIYLLDKYSDLRKPQETNSYHFNVFQEYLLNYISGVLDQCKLCINPKIQEKMKSYFDSTKDIWNKAISKQELFYQIDSCSQKKIINKHLIKIRKILIEGNLIDILNSYYLQKIIDLNIPRCTDCLSCIDFISNINIIAGLINQTMTVKEAKEILYYNQQLDIIDTLFELTNGSPKPRFNTTKLYNKSDKRLVYLDSNIFMDIENKTPNINEMQAILFSKQHYDYYYSPSHLEDIFKRDLSDVSVVPILSIIEEITDGLFIHRVDDIMRLDYELPQHSYQRTNNENSKQITEMVERYHINTIEAGIHFFPQYHTSKHKRDINNKDLFGQDRELLEKALSMVGAVFNLDDVKSLDINNIKYKELNDIIYKLLKAMDILSFYCENSRNIKKLRSSVHDTEHLIYATYADILVTNDKKLYHRSKQILGYTMPNIKVMKFEEFKLFITQD